MSISNTPSAERPIYKRWTIIGVAIISLIQALTDADLVPVGTPELLASWGQIAGGFLTSLGLYRHIPTT